MFTGALYSGETAKPELLEKPKGELGERVGKFRRRLKIAEIKGGPDEGMDRVGQGIVVMGWVRTLRAQSSITFMEVSVVHYVCSEAMCQMKIGTASLQQRISAKPNVSIRIL